ncbi:DsbA family protein [Pseudooceanicola sp. 502str34]
MTSTRRQFLSLTGAAASTVVLAPLAAHAQTPTVEEVLRDPDAPVMGNPQGDVTLVEYFDYQCGYCKSMHPLVRDVVEADGNVRLVMKDWPIFGRGSQRAAELALGTVALGRYPAAVDALMATRGRLNDASIKAALKDIVPVEDANNSFYAERRKWERLLSRNDQQATALGFRGTPSFVIGQVLYPGAIDRDTLLSAIRAARAA